MTAAARRRTSDREPATNSPVAEPVEDSAPRNHTVVPRAMPVVAVVGADLAYQRPRRARRLAVAVSRRHTGPGYGTVVR